MKALISYTKRMAIIKPMEKAFAYFKHVIIDI